MPNSILRYTGFRAQHKIINGGTLINVHVHVLIAEFMEDECVNSVNPHTLKGQTEKHP